MACAKCAFVILIMTAGNPDAADKIWGDVAVINQASLTQHLIELLDPNFNKPLECVGTRTECQIAARLILKHSQLLNKPTKDIMTKYAQLGEPRKAAQDLAFLQDFDSESSVPDRYGTLLQDMKATLHNLAMVVSKT